MKRGCHQRGQFENEELRNSVEVQKDIVSQTPSFEDGKLHDHIHTTEIPPEVPGSASDDAAHITWNKRTKMK